MIARRIGSFEVIGTLVRGGGVALVQPRRVSFDDTLAQMRSIGLGALPTACLITFTAGYVLALVLELQLSQVGRVELVPAMLWIISTEQIVPLGVAFIFTGRSVSAVSAELGSMQVSEEIKALFTMGIDFISYLLLRGYLAVQIMISVVTIV
jgi:phospholipid/cholesterol/gamma-HCH transport system permease protein